MIEQILKKRMELAGITQANLAQISGTTPSQMGLFLKGKASLNREALDICLESLGAGLSIQENRLDLAAKVAKKFKEIPLEVIYNMSREEMAKKSGYEQILALPDISLDEFEKMVKSGIADYESTYPFFKVIVMHYYNTGEKITGTNAKNSFNTILRIGAVAATVGAVGLLGGLILAPITLAATKLLEKKVLTQSAINAWTPFLTMTFDLLKKRKE